MMRKLAVPLTPGEQATSEQNRIVRTLRVSDEGSEDARVMVTLAANRMLLKRIERDLEEDRIAFHPDDLVEELNMIDSAVRVDLVEMSDELEETPYADEAFAEAVA